MARRWATRTRRAPAAALRWSATLIRAAGRGYRSVDRWIRTAHPQPSTWSSRRRWASAVLLVLAAVAAITITGYRTLRPAEDLRKAINPLPSPVDAKPRLYGELGAAPLIVEGRLRVFTEQRRIWAETPVTARRQVTPHWSYRRWPAEPVGIITVEPTLLWGGPTLVITKWSDGEVIALHAASGTEVWKARVEPDPEETYQGRRTGAHMVYAPEGLFTAVSASDGRLVLIVAGKDQVHAFDPVTGTQRWARSFAGQPGCRRVDWTGETTYVVKDSCAAPAVLEVFDAETGGPRNSWRPSGASAGPGREANWFVQPVACRLGRSRCQLFRASASADVISVADAARGVRGVVTETWSLGPTGSITVEPGVESDAPLVAADTRVEQMLNGYVWAHSRATGRLLWVSSRPALLLTVDGSAAYLADNDRDLLVVDVATGHVKSMIDPPLRYGTNWQAGYVFVHSGFLAVERLGSGKETDDDAFYYYAANPVLLVGA